MKLESINIQSFRGIPNECTVSFVDGKGMPCSTLIYGGNGSGKSSVIDAIEYALQGRIERTSQLNNYKRPSAINFSRSVMNVSPTITVEFDDGSSYSRHITSIKNQDNDYIEIENNKEQALADFSVISMALRRNDIIAYNRAKIEEKVLLFSGFILNHQGIKSTAFQDDPEITNKKSKIIKKQKQKLKLFEEISQLSEISVAELQQTKDAISNYVRSKVAPLSGEMIIVKNAFKQKMPRDKYNKITALADKASEIQASKKKLEEELKHLENLSKSLSFDDFKDYLVPASLYLSEAFKTISNATYLDRIDIERGETATTFDFKITLKNGMIVYPNQIFSEANYDLMILLLYVSLIRVGVDRGQSKVIIFDDVLQSVDANIRTRFMEYVLDVLNDWQIIMTCHDRLWLNQLHDIFKRHNHCLKLYHIKSWSFEMGPCIVEQNFFTPDVTLEQAMKTGNPRIISSTAGLLLEKICNNLSYSLKCKIERTKNDLYTLDPGQTHQLFPRFFNRCPYPLPS